MSATAKKSSYVPKSQRKPIRNKMYGKLHALWSWLRPDLAKGSTDYKEALYLFAEGELKIGHIGSFTNLTDKQLGKVIEALEREAGQPRLYRTVQSQESGVGSPGQVLQGNFGSKAQGTRILNDDSPVEHLASEQQRWAINQVFGYLGWSDDFKAGFVKARFRTDKIEMLRNKEAHSLLAILLQCAGSKYWRRQGKDKVSKPMVTSGAREVKKILKIG
jgi:hypothetical protein